MMNRTTTTKSGWCLDGRHGEVCLYAYCSCHCHESLTSRRRSDSVPRMMNCDTDFAHCTACGSYALRDVATDTGYRRTSLCCASPVSATVCKEKHPAYIPTRSKITDAAEYKREKMIAKKNATPPAKTPRAAGSHANCDHPATSAARRECRKNRSN